MLKNANGIEKIYCNSQNVINDIVTYLRNLLKKVEQKKNEIFLKWSK